MSECKERSGFLFSHACDWPATAQCKSCAKAVCSNHVRQVDADHFCIACMKKKVEQAGASPGQGAQGVQEGQQGAMYSRSYRGRSYYNDPYWYGSYHYPYYYHHHYYDADDHRSFDRQRSSTGEDLEGDAMGS